MAPGPMIAHRRGADEEADVMMGAVLRSDPQDKDADMAFSAIFKALAWMQMPLANVLALAVRITVGHAFALTGYGKVFINHAGTTDFFRGLGIPAPEFHAWGIGWLELAGGILLMLGLLTRPLALLLIGTMTVAIITADRADFLAAWAIRPDRGLIEVDPWLFGVLCLMLLTYGAGRLSGDRLVARIFAPDAPAGAGAKKTGKD
jgi:putative oxidoreductase